MRRFVVMATLTLLPSIAMARQPGDRKIFPAEIRAEDVPPAREVPPMLPSPRFPRAVRLEAPLLDEPWSRVLLDAQTPRR